MKSYTYYPPGGERPELDLHAVVVDSQGQAARIKLKDLPHGLLRACDGLMVLETGYVVKPCIRFGFPQVGSQDLPEAKPIYARLKCNYELAGQQARVFNIGLSATNGFSIPSHDTIEKVYVVVPPEEERK